jgi:alpha-maltose-1-phosphate synthase
VPNKRYDTHEILFIGVEFERKGGDYLLRAFNNVREKFPRAILHIVGPRQLAVPASLESQVIHHGFLSKQDPAGAKKLHELFRRSCLFVMPSLYEPFGIAPLEAMSYGLPCVVSNGWALSEIVNSGVTGELVEPGSVEDLTDKILRLLGDPDLLCRMGEAGRKRVEREYSWDNVVDRIVQLIG